jgi:hypothetical protein
MPDFGTHRITSPEALRLTRLVVAAEWQVTLVLLSNGLQTWPCSASEEAGRVRMSCRSRRA